LEKFSAAEKKVSPQLAQRWGLGGSSLAGDSQRTFWEKKRDRWWPCNSRNWRGKNANLSHHTNHRGQGAQCGKKKRDESLWRSTKKEEIHKKGEGDNGSWGGYSQSREASSIAAGDKRTEVWRKGLSTAGESLKKKKGA